MALGRVRDLVQRCRTACFANLGLKLIALVIAIIIHVLMQPSPEQPAPADEPPVCPP